MHNNEPTTVATLLEKIRKNEIVVKSKTYFKLKLGILVALLVVLFVVSLFFASFILFTLQASGHAALVDFGPSGWQVFVTLFPWKLLTLEVLLLVALQYLLRSFRFGYKIPVLYLFIALIFFMMISGTVVGQTPLHRSLLEHADRKELPVPFGDLYEGARRPPARDSGIFRGTITDIRERDLFVELDNPEGLGTTTSVLVHLSKRFPERHFEVGDTVFFAGKILSGEITPEAIRSAENLLPPPPRR